ncbi:MAG: putative zinc-binding metallopeptidase [Halieaceae bacterium]
MPLYCQCGQIVFCDNTRCEACGRTLGFLPRNSAMISADTHSDGSLLDDHGNSYQLCANRREYMACNGLVASTEATGPETLCDCCQLNRTIPIVDRPENVSRWQKLERAKRRMIAGLSALGLDVNGGGFGSGSVMRFDFLEDQRSHPDVLESFVSTGHKDGVITINLMEADDVQRVTQRELMGERYRTLLGHFRHEAGHYFYTPLVTAPAAFASIFGDPLADYANAVEAYYERGPAAGWDEQYISAYASSHPLEDWAECFAHYLHIQDTLDTAAAHKLVHATNGSLREQLQSWGELTVAMNELSRSLGLRDPYPFVLQEPVIAKLEYVHATIADARTGQASFVG